MTVDIPEVSIAEIKEASKAIKAKKALGPDLIPPPLEVIMTIVDDQPEKVLEPINRTLVKGEFPREWNKGRLVLTEKENKAHVPN